MESVLSARRDRCLRRAESRAGLPGDRRRNRLRATGEGVLVEYSVRQAPLQGCVGVDIVLTLWMPRPRTRSRTDRLLPERIPRPAVL